MTEPRRRKPTIEHRLEAITQTLEIVAGMQIATEKELTRIVMTSHETRIKKLERK